MTLELIRYNDWEWELERVVELSCVGLGELGEGAERESCIASFKSNHFNYSWTEIKLSTPYRFVFSPPHKHPATCILFQSMSLMSFVSCSVKTSKVTKLQSSLSILLREFVFDIIKYTKQMGGVYCHGEVRFGGLSVYRILCACNQNGIVWIKIKRNSFYQTTF